MLESTQTGRTNSAMNDPSIQRGCVELICGCMFSGKTTRLLDTLRHETADAILIVKHSKDDRYNRSRVVTHDGESCEAVNIARAQDILDEVSEVTEVIAIDEGHFYDDQLPEVCRALADRGKRVIVTALDLDMWGQPFPVVDAVKRVSGVVHVQLATCAACGKPATHTYRKTPIRGRKLVGGEDDFEPRCQDCWSPAREEPIDSASME